MDLISCGTTFHQWVCARLPLIPFPREGQERSQSLPVWSWAEPTMRIVIVWPNPQSAPISAAGRMLLWRLAIVVTAMTWSGSVAGRMPRKKPSARMESSGVISFSM
jgi:hypothetical protein